MKCSIVTWFDNFDRSFPELDKTVHDSNTGAPSYKDYWQVKDHLGSVRAVYDLSTTGTIDSKKKELSDYQPYGNRIARTSTSYNHWRFSGKEEQKIDGTDFGLLDFGARYYDPWLARWTTQAPLAHKYAGINPYVYCNGDPVNLVDEEGQSWYYSIVDGSFVALIDDDDDRVYMLSEEQIMNANGDLSVLKSYRKDGKLFGSLAFDGIIDEDIAMNVISDLFNRANRKEEGGEDKIINQPVITIDLKTENPQYDASSTSKKLFVYLRSGAYYRGYDIISLFAHEIGHTVHRNKIGKPSAFNNMSEREKESFADDFSTAHWSYEKISNYRRQQIKEHKRQNK